MNNKLTNRGSSRKFLVVGIFLGSSVAACGNASLQVETVSVDGAPFEAPTTISDVMPLRPIPTKTIGAYAVANHLTCGASNIPGTIGDVAGFLAGKPSDFRTNFSLSNDTVHAEDWHRTSDLFAATTPTRQGGADSSLITYIASHGGTSGGIFTASMGNTLYGGCGADSSNMGLGDGKTRYLFASTCESVKIGSGEDPYIPGSVPSLTWGSAARGLRCIYGYSSVSLDSDAYGTLFWNKLPGATSLTSAFFDASWDIYTDQVPAALCYGSSRDAARRELDATSFDTAAASGSFWGVWRWRNREPVVSTTRLPTRELRPSQVEALPGSALPESAVAVARASLPSAHSRKSEGVAQHLWFSNDDAVRHATNFLNQWGLNVPAAELTPESVRVEAESDPSGQILVREKTVIFRQHVASVPILDGQYQLRLTLDASGRVVDLYDGTVRVAVRALAPTGGPPRQPGADEEDTIERSLLSLAQKRIGPNSTELRLKSVEMGFRIGVRTPGKRVEAAYHGVVSARSGQFQRLYPVQLAAQ